MKYPAFSFLLSGLLSFFKALVQHSRNQPRFELAILQSPSGSWGLSVLWWSLSQWVRCRDWKRNTYLNRPEMPCNTVNSSKPEDMTWSDWCLVPWIFWSWWLCVFLQFVFVTLQVAQEGFHFGFKYFLSQTTVCFLHKVSNQSYNILYLQRELLPKALYSLSLTEI